MTQFFFDVNVSLDIILKAREPYHDQAQFLIDSALVRAIKLMISAANVSTMIYHVNKHKTPDADDLIWSLLKQCDIVNPYKSTISTAFRSEFHDKEDASEYFTALDNHADYFLTRDLKDYKKSLSPILPVLTPVQFKDIIGDHTIFVPLALSNDHEIGHPCYPIPVSRHRRPRPGTTTRKLRHRRPIYFRDR